MTVSYQLQFKDYAVYEDFTDTDDGQDGMYDEWDEAREAEDMAKELYPLTDFRIVRVVC
jgi:hypothetical protein